MNNPTFSLLLVKRSDGSTRPATCEEVIATAQHYIARRVRRGARLHGSRATCELLTLKMGALDHEAFAVIFVDRRHRVIRYEEMFRGTIDTVVIHPREVVKGALKHNAAAVILAHAHPAGVTELTAADEAIYLRLKPALTLLDIRILDHVIVVGGDAISLAERVKYNK